MHVFMAVTRDKYELPIAVADTSIELAKIMNTTDTAIRSCIYREKTGKNKSCMYKKVHIEDEEMEE